MEFSAFLTKYLKEKKIDVSVYHSYLMGILEDNLEEDERREMVSDIIGSLIETDTEAVVNTIFDKWNEVHAAPTKVVEEKQQEVDIAELLKTQTTIALQSSSHANRQLTDEEKRVKQQILQSYSQCAVEEDDDEEAQDSGDDDDPDMGKNTNKSDVQKLAREKREQARLESAQKKQKDKEDRAKQKTAREEKKSKRQSATVKGERKR